MSINRETILDYNEQTEEIEWKSIGEVAKMYDIDTARLRDWCNKGIVEAIKTNSGRKIPSTEFQKLKKIKNIFDSGKEKGIRVTFDDVKEELRKDDLLKSHLGHIEKEKEHKGLKRALSTVFQEIGLDKSLFGLAEKVNSIESKLNQQTQLLEDEETKQQREEQMQQDIQEIKKLYKEEQERRQESEELNRQLQSQLNSIQNELNTINGRLEQKSEESQKEPKSKGFFSRLFNP